MDAVAEKGGTQSRRKWETIQKNLSRGRKKEDAAENYSGFKGERSREVQLITDKDLPRSDQTKEGYWGGKRRPRGKRGNEGEECAHAFRVTRAVR